MVEDKKEELTQVVPATDENKNDLVTGNDYLTKEQQRYFANQWTLQQNYYANCGSVPSITLDKEYKAKSASREQQSEIRVKAHIYEKLNVTNTFKIGLENLPSHNGNIDEFKKSIKDLQKEIDIAEEDYIVYGADIYFGIPKDTALKYFEEISPYVMGRKYLNDLKVFGTSNDKSKLVRFTRDLTERKYY